MTIPLSPAFARRGPRETLLALTEVYLRCGELDGDARHCVAVLAGRCQGPGVSQGRGADVSAPPEWAPLAAALAAMLRGEAERTVKLVTEALAGEATPGALRRALLGLGARAALAADRPALARSLQSRLRAHSGAAAGGSGASAVPGGDGPRQTVPQSEAVKSVLASLPELVRELIDGTSEGYHGGGEAYVDASFAAQAPSTGDDEGESPPPGREDDETQPRAGSSGGVPGSEGPATAVLHVVMNAYHGDVVSSPVRVEVIASTLAAGPAGEAAASTPAAAASEVGSAWDAGGLPVLRVRVAGRGPLPDPPQARAWHLRFVGRARALDARTSDSSLVDLTWEDAGFVATFHPPEWLDELDDGPEVLATRVTHVVLVPESEEAVGPVR